MTTDRTISISATHAYPGCSLTSENSLAENGDGPCLITFSDGAFVVGLWQSLDGQTWCLTIPSYKTTSGTTVAEKAWRVIADGNSRYKITRRYAPPSVDPV